MSHPTPSLFGRLHRINVRTHQEDLQCKDRGDMLYIDNGTWFCETKRCKSSADVEEAYGITPEEVLILVFKFGQIHIGEYRGIFYDKPGVSPFDIDARFGKKYTKHEQST